MRGKEGVGGRRKSFSCTSKHTNMLRERERGVSQYRIHTCNVMIMA